MAGCRPYRKIPDRHSRRVWAVLFCWVLAGGSGCGTVKSRSATEQLLVSDAVDRSVSQIDFRPLSGKKVYLDTTYLKPVQGTGFVNADYIISSLRQQMITANCFLQDSSEQADVIVEARVGALGSNDHEVNYGVPANNTFSAASSLIPTVPTVPTIPELSIAKRNEFLAAAKLAVFAYDRHTRRPMWQSGLSRGESKAKAMWVMGAGPFESGSIYEQTRFAGAPIRVPTFGSSDEETVWTTDGYYQARDYQKPEFARLPSDETDTHAVPGRW